MLFNESIENFQFVIRNGCNTNISNSRRFG